MRSLLLSTFFLLSRVSFGQVDITSPSGIYEVGNGNKKVLDITYDSYFVYDTIKRKADVNDAYYEILHKNELICTIVPKLNKYEVMVSIVYPDYALKTLHYPNILFEDTGDHLIYRDKLSLLGFFSKMFPVIVVNIPIYYKGKDYILHMRPHFE